MDLRQLEILRAVAERGSFTGAGRHLHLSQSAVSRQILLLEDELKEPLFLRIGRKVRITPAGDQLLQLSYRVFNDMAETQAAIREGQQTLKGTLRLMGGMTVCLYVFPALLVRGERTRANFRYAVESQLRCLPKSTTEIAVIPGAHHAWNMANPRGSAEAILGFLAKH